MGGFFFFFGGGGKLWVVLLFVFVLKAPCSFNFFSKLLQAVLFEGIGKGTKKWVCITS